MVNNLEHISKSQVVSPEGTPYSVFRETLKPRYGVVWRDIAIGYAFIVASVGSFAYLEAARPQPIWPMVVLVPIWAIFLAFWVAFVQLFVHEAAHYNIHPNRKINDMLASVFLCLMLGVNMEAYRNTHLKHHKRLGFTDDTENSYFNGLTWGFILQTLCGIHALRILIGRNRLVNNQTPETLRKQKISLIYGLIFHLVIVGAMLQASLWLTAVVWVLAFGVFYPFWATIRQILEHRDENASPSQDFSRINHGKVSRLFDEGVFAYFFGGAGFNRHLLHHWDPSVSYTRLAEVEEFLSRTETCGPIIRASKTNYFKTFLRLLR